MVVVRAVVDVYACLFGGVGLSARGYDVGDVCGF